MRGHVVMAGLVLLGLAGCGNGDDKADAGAQLACQHFRNVANDYRDGVLTPSELRDKLKEVDSDASVSEEPGVASAARQLLAAATDGDEDAMAVQVTALDKACTAAGV